MQIIQMGFVFVAQAFLERLHLEVRRILLEELDDSKLQSQVTGPWAQFICIYFYFCDFYAIYCDDIHFRIKMQKENLFFSRRLQPKPSKTCQKVF
jgi:hypothetical protein